MAAPRLSVVLHENGFTFSGNVKYPRVHVEFKFCPERNGYIITKFECNILRKKQRYVHLLILYYFLSIKQELPVYVYTAPYEFQYASDVPFSEMSITAHWDGVRVTSRSNEACLVNEVKGLRNCETYLKRMYRELFDYPTLKVSYAPEEEAA